MAFPTTPRDTTVELYVNNTWVDVTADVRDDPGIGITRGRPNESSQPQPSSCMVTLDNRSGNYSLRNPTGAYYGQLTRNTPIRVAVTIARDTFTRTSVDSWGATDTGQTWANAGTNWQVASGVGTHSMPVVNINRVSYLPALGYRNVDVALSFSLPFAPVTGADISANILLRGGDPTDNAFYLARTALSPTGAVTLGFIYRDGVGGFLTLSSFAAVPGITHAAGQFLRMRVQCDADTLRAKLWVASNPEPFGWHVTIQAFNALNPGWVGVRTDVQSGNTNTLPIVMSYDNLTVRSMRFSGEVSSWPQIWDTSGNDIRAPIEAAGVTRRLKQGTAVQQSTMYRGITGLVTPPVAYWPAEDGSDASTISSGVGGPPMLIVSGAADFASYSGIPASRPLPTMTNSIWNGVVPPYTHTGEVMLRFLLHAPAGSIVDTGIIAQLFVAGSAHHWELKYGTGGSLKLQAWTVGDTLLLDTGPIGFDIDGKPLMMSIELTQVGSNIDWRMARLEVGAFVGNFWSGTLNSHTIGAATRVVFATYGQLTSASVGHITVRDDVTDLFDLSNELNAYSGIETAITRIRRLGEENNIETVFINEVLQNSEIIGPQRALTLFGLLTETADADSGTLYDTRADNGVTYREHSSLYNQNDVFTLDYGGAQVAPPFEPVDDDQLTSNDVTVTRLGGGSARAQLVTGRMSVLEPAEGGAGRYQSGSTLNVGFDTQLDNIAGFKLHLGTVDESRYPTVNVDLGSAAVVADPALSAKIIDFDIGDRFVITNPSDGHTPDNIVQLALGYREHISSFRHTISINAAPAAPYEVLELDSGTGFSGKLGTAGSVLGSGATSTATSLSVATADGTLWTTSGANMPTPVMLGGEELSVTAISGTGSPQTFTVTRSVNGVTKSHSAGAEIRLKNPPTLAL
ncbi:MAG: hypothetical protein ACRDRC_01770 [Pseudonocardiaceae bacterium]